MTSKKAVAETVEHIDVPVFVKKFFPCACACNCGRESVMPALGSAALGRHARCEECGEDRHIAQYPEKDVDGDEATSKDTTDVYVLSEEEREASMAAQKEVYNEIWSKQWAHWQASLPEKFKNAETEHPQIQERLRRLALGERGVASMVILGAPGLGKTWLAVGYANEAIKTGLLKPSEVMFGSEAELLSSVANSSFGEVEAGLRKLISPRVKMLIIDDVGRGTWLNEAMRPKVFSLVLDKFWSENRVVIVTSNLAPADLAEYIGDGAMDRLRSMVGNSSLVLDTESKRRKVTEEMLARVSQEPVPVAPPEPKIIS